MGFMDKIKQSASKAKEKATNFSQQYQISEKFSSVRDSVKKSVGESSAKMKEWNSTRKELAQPLEEAIKRYTVAYIGGIPAYPKKKSGFIGMNIMPDHFAFRPTIGTKDWFNDYDIPYHQISELTIEKRTISTEEILLGAGDNANQQQENVICIFYTDAEGQKLTLRIEMMTGINIYQQAATCRELMALLRQHNITEQFQNTKKETSSENDIFAQLEKLDRLKTMGILTEEEFNEKKKVLLEKI